VRISGSSRWRLPPHYSLDVIELAPAANPAWLPAANPANWFPEPSDAQAIQVALVDVANDDLIQAAELKLTPRWFSARSSRPDQIERAFHMLAASLASG